MRLTSISRKPGAFGAIVLTGAGLAVGGCFFAAAFFTGAVVLVIALASASAFGLELLVPEMRPPSPRPSLVLELDMFEELFIEKQG